MLKGWVPDKKGVKLEIIQFGLRLDGSEKHPVKREKEKNKKKPEGNIEI